MPRNVDMLERVGGIFNHADSLLYPRTHINRVDGLLVNGKLDMNLLPDSIKTGIRRVGNLTANKTLAELLTLMDAELTALGLPQEARSGSYFYCATSVVISLATTHVVNGGDDGGGDSPLILEPNDWIMYDKFDELSSNHIWTVINNTQGAVTDSTPGLMLSEHKTKLDGIAANANNYAHPSYTQRNVDTSGITVLDTFASDNQGHVTGIGTRELPLATEVDHGVMSNSDKSKLNGIEAGANNYSLPIASPTVLGGVKVGNGLSIASGILSNASPNKTHTGEVTGDEALTITNGVVTNAKLASVPGFTFKGRNLSNAGAPMDLSVADARALLNVEDGANNYVHPILAQINVDASTVETIDQVYINHSGHVTGFTKQSIRVGTTSQTGLLQLATGAELTTPISTKAVSPVAVKSMIDYFAGMKRYANLTEANAANVADGTIALVTVS